MNITLKTQFSIMLFMLRGERAQSHVRLPTIFYL